MLDNPVKESRYDILYRAQGTITQTWDRQVTRSTATVTSQRVFYQSIALRAGEVITNIHVFIATQAGASSTTTAKVGLYDKAGNRLAVSANLTSAWESTGMKTHALSSPYTVPADDQYFIAILYDGSSAPVMNVAGGIANMGAVIGSGAIAYGAVSTQTDLDSSETIASANSQNFWAAVS